MGSRILGLAFLKAWPRWLILIKSSESNSALVFKKLKFYPIIEVDNDLYKIDLDTNSDTLINVNCINVPTGISSNSRIDISQFGEGFFISYE